MGSRASSGLLPSPRAIPAVGGLAGEGDAASIPLSSLSSQLLLSHLRFLVRVTALSPDCVQMGGAGGRRVLRALVSWKLRMKRQDGGAGHLARAESTCQPPFHRKSYGPMGEWWAEESRTQWWVVGLLLPKWPEVKGIVVLFCNISASTAPSNVLGRQIWGTDWGWPCSLSSFSDLRQLKEERILVSGYTRKGAYDCWFWRCKLKQLIRFHTLGRPSKRLTILRMGEVRSKPLWWCCKKSIWEVIWQNLLKATYTAGTLCLALNASLSHSYDYSTSDYQPLTGEETGTERFSHWTKVIWPLRISGSIKTKQSDSRALALIQIF